MLCRNLFSARKRRASKRSLIIVSARPARYKTKTVSKKVSLKSRTVTGSQLLSYLRWAIVSNNIQKTLGLSCFQVFLIMQGLFPHVRTYNRGQKSWGSTVRKLLRSFSNSFFLSSFFMKSKNIFFNACPTHVFQALHFNDDDILKYEMFIVHNSRSPRTIYLSTNQLEYINRNFPRTTWNSENYHSLKEQYSEIFYPKRLSFFYKCRGLCYKIYNLSSFQ